jgi:hypothetical protein
MFSLDPDVTHKERARIISDSLQTQESRGYYESIKGLTNKTDARRLLRIDMQFA